MVQEVPMHERDEVAIGERPTAPRTFRHSSHGGTVRRSRALRNPHAILPASHLLRSAATCPSRPPLFGASPNSHQPRLTFKLRHYPPLITTSASPPRRLAV